MSNKTIESGQLSATTEVLIDICLWITLLTLTIGALAAAAFQIEAVAFRYPLDYGEAPLLNQAEAINAGRSIYKNDIHQAPYTITNYPPVYVGILAFLSRIFGPAFWYGRLVSSLSAFGSAVLIVTITASRSHNLKLAMIPGLLFINLPYVVGWSTLARIDHLALFFALAGLLSLFKIKFSNRLINRSLVIGSVFLILAIFTRQSYALAAPLAGFFYLFKKDWKRGLLLMGLVGGGSLLIFLIINAVTNGGFYFNIVTANINTFIFKMLIDNFQRYFTMAPVVFIASTLGLVIIHQKIHGWPMITGFAIGGLLSALTIGKIGSNVNYFLEFSAAMCFLIGFALFVLYRQRRRWFFGGLLCLMLFSISWQGFELIHTVQADTRGTLRDRRADLDELITMENLVIQNLDGPILADEYMGMIVLNGQALSLQPFEITQLVNANEFDQKILIDQITSEQFSLILLQEGSWWSQVVQERWSPEMLEAIRENYRLTAQLENTFVYQPKNQKGRITPADCPTGLWPLPSNAYLGYRFDNGLLTLYGAGAEGQVPVLAVAAGKVFRPETFPEGSLAVIHDDPINIGEKVMVIYGDMRRYQGEGALIEADFPPGANGISVQKGTQIGSQSMWSGKAFQQNWLHVNIGVAHYQEEYLRDFDLLMNNLVDPAKYFGLKIDPQSKNVKPIECLP